MRNLVVFLARNYFFLLFLLLEIVSLYFLVQRNYFQHASAVAASNKFTGTLFEARTQLVEYLDLKEQNRQLSDRLAAALNNDSTSQLLYTSKTTSVTDTFYKQHYEFLSARVIDNTVTQRNNYIILDRGSLQGVLPDMGVVCSEGVVGIVREVSDNFCVVMSLLHKDSKISASVKRDGTFGQVLWKDDDDYSEATMIDLPTHSQIAKGDTLITSGLGDAFPEGVAVGTVASFGKKPGDKTYTVEVKLATDFRKIRHVFIVKNLVREELEELRAKIPPDNGK
jgi:rod shape-determining protein MreC